MTSLYPDLGVVDAVVGLAARAAMAEMRYGARALAAIGRGPATVLGDLAQRLAGMDRADTFATAIYGRLDLEDNQLQWANAGHLPPVLITSDGRACLLDGPLAPPLGAPQPGPASVKDQELVLGPGEVLALYTDGIVERRGEPLDVGIARLLAALASGTGLPLDNLADAIVASYCQKPSDDCCLLLVRRSMVTQG